MCSSNALVPCVTWQSVQLGTQRSNPAKEPPAAPAPCGPVLRHVGHRTQVLPGQLQAADAARLQVGQHVSRWDWVRLRLHKKYVYKKCMQGALGKKWNCHCKSLHSIIPTWHTSLETGQEIVCTWLAGCLARNLGRSWTEELRWRTEWPALRSRGHVKSIHAREFTVA